MSTQLVAYLRLDARGADTERRTPLTLRQDFQEGYPIRDAFSIHGVTLTDLQRMADWMITLPADQYAPLADIHRALERAIIADQERWSS